ncbi:MAG: hypothetical protein AAF471_01750 [Myxococcota bacterium]
MSKPPPLLHPAAAISTALARQKELQTATGQRWIQEAIANGRARHAGGMPFEEKMAQLTATLANQFAESARLQRQIESNLAALGFKLDSHEDRDE